MRRTVILAAATLVFGHWSYGQAPPGGSGQRCDRSKIVYVLDHYDAEGKQIRVERYEPSGAGKYPVVIFIHGSGGLYSRGQSQSIPEKDNFGETTFACSGYVALVVHYFDSSGIVAASDVGFMRSESALWIKVLRAAMDYALQLQKVDRARLFLFGESLGGYLALELAARDPRIKAVSEVSAGLPPELSGRLPPVLIQHGEQDTVVPVEQAYKLERVLRERQVFSGIRTYAAIGHYLDERTKLEVVRQTVAFFTEAGRRSARRGAH